jgi:hypothetical protein
MLDAAITIGIYQRQLHQSMRHPWKISCLNDRVAFMVFAKLSRYRQFRFDCNDGFLGLFRMPIILFPDWHIQILHVSLP